MILLAAPTSEKKKYCQKDWIEHISKLNPQPDRILIVDNSNTDENYYKLKSYNIPNMNVMWVKPESDKESIRYRVLKCMKLIRQICLQYEYDLFSLESDQFPPVNVISLLQVHNKSVVSIPYFIYEKDRTTICNMSKLSINGAAFTDMMHPKAAFLFCDGKLKKGYQNGLGCMLIRNEILKRIPFRLQKPDEKGIPEDAFPDFLFHLDLLQNKIDNWIDTRFFSWHLNNLSNWKKIEKEI